MFYNTSLKENESQSEIGIFIEKSENVFYDELQENLLAVEMKNNPLYENPYLNEIKELPEEEDREDSILCNHENNTALSTKDSLCYLLSDVKFSLKKIKEKNLFDDSIDEDKSKLTEPKNQFSHQGNPIDSKENTQNYSNGEKIKFIKNFKRKCYKNKITSLRFICSHMSDNPAIDTEENELTGKKF